MTRPAVFLDRDGTLIEEVHYLDRHDRLALFPWSIDAVRVLNRAGFAVVVVTNQAGVARGLFDEAFVEEVHRSLARRFAAGGARLDGFYYCPHHPDASVAAYRRACECRKPKPGLLHQAARDHDLALTRSFIVGDRWSDVALAEAVGAQGVLVRTGYGAVEAAARPEGLGVVPTVDNLMAAAAWILGAGGR
jgi:D-glycero-D-manno-heptose 1,7-bisphosphate phosphatase